MAPTVHTAPHSPHPLQYLKFQAKPSSVCEIHESGQLSQHTRHSVHFSLSCTGRLNRQLPVIIPVFSETGEGTVPAKLISLSPYLVTAYTPLKVSLLLSLPRYLHYVHLIEPRPERFLVLHHSYKVFHLHEAKHSISGTYHGSSNPFSDAGCVRGAFGSG